MSWTLFDVIVTDVDRGAGELTGLALGDSVGGRAARHRCERGGSTALWTYRFTRALGGDPVEGGGRSGLLTTARPGSGWDGEEMV